MEDGDNGWGMGQTRLRILFWIVVSLLIASVIAGGAILISRYVGRSEPVELAVSGGTPALSLEVYMSGAVDNAGIYTVGQDASLREVLNRAGVVTDEADPVRLKVCVLHDGEDPFDQGEPADASEGKVNVNVASTDQLEELPGIGPVKAQAIVDYRTENGFFCSVDDLINVPGIGPVTLDAIRDQVTVVD